MRFHARWMYGLMVGVAATTAGPSWAQERSVSTSVTSPAAVVAPVANPVGETSAESESLSAPPLGLVPLDPGTVFTPVRVGEWPGGVTAGVLEGQRTIYSNSLGNFAVAIPAGFRLADDMTLAIGPGCRLRGLEIPVVGRVNPLGTGGPYTVTLELFSNCPNSVPQTNTELNRIRIFGTATQVTFPDDQPHLISVQYGAGIALPVGVTSVWLAVTFNRSNAGLVMGAPALQGMTCDLYDFPGVGGQCNSSFGGFPDHAFGAMNAELFGDIDTCLDAHVGYRANRPAQSIYNPGANVTLTDDIRLGVPTCRMVAYEVAVKGQAGYFFELRNVCDTPAIPGTGIFFSPPQGTSPAASVIARQTFNPPITIPQNFVFAATVTNSTGGVVLSGQQACVGSTLDQFEVPDELGGCTPIPSPFAGQLAALNVTIFCAGPAPVGACCDMFFTDNEGESVCREGPQMNCPFPPRFSTTLRPFWESGDTCSPDPFTPDCGLSCCCEPDGTVSNLTQNQCNALEPLTQPRQWQRGLPCGVSGQRCPIIACLARKGECTTARICPLSCPLSCRQDGINCPPTGCEECPPVGCDNAICCTDVCERDDFCCLVQWDEACASIANQICDDIQPANDVCAPSGRLEGATLLSIPDSQESSIAHATEADTDPGFGCYLDNPGQEGLHTVWYKFVAPPPIAPATLSILNLQTCASNNPANDSLMQVFAVGDPTNKITQCNSLIPYGCNDDFAGPGCTRVTTLSRMCLRRLVPGNTYYIMVAAKTRTTNVVPQFRVDISQVGQCITQLPDDTNDFCPQATSVSNGVTPFNLARVSPPYFLDGVESCVPSMTADLWFNYTATCTGSLNVRTCGPNAEQTQDTNLAVYSSCPTTSSSAPLACSQDAGGTCGLGSDVTLDVVQGQPLKIRVGDSAQNLASGNLTISCAQATCPAGEITIVETGDNGIPFEAVDARRPHDPANAATLLGTQTVQVVTTRDAQASCFSFCETASSGSPNSITSIVPGAIDGAQQTFTINLARAITGGAKTTLIYSPDGATPDSYVRLLSHPGNVNADATMDAADVNAVRDALNALTVPAFGLRSYDLNRSVGNLLSSSGITPADILEAVDLFNGAGEYTPWQSTPNPRNNPACP